MEPEVKIYSQAEIIKNEARLCFENEIQYSERAFVKDDIYQIKTWLDRLYSNRDKSLFLDELIEHLRKIPLKDMKHQAYVYYIRQEKLIYKD